MILRRIAGEADDASTRDASAEREPVGAGPRRGKRK